MKYIYVYSTGIYSRVNYYKVGETVQDPQARVKAQDKTANPEELVLIDYWEVEDHITDKMIHEELTRRGIHKTRDNREWFECEYEKLRDNISDILENGPYEEPPIGFWKGLFTIIALLTGGIIVFAIMAALKEGKR